jgi:hypothetical protein
VRVTHLDSKAILRFALVFGASILLLDLLVIVIIWIALGAAGIFSALGVALAFGSLLGIAFLLSLAHAAVSAVFVWLAATAFNLTAQWTGGVKVDIEDMTPVQSHPTVPEAIVLPDTEFGGAPKAGVTSPSRSSVERTTTEHEGL